MQIVVQGMMGRAPFAGQTWLYLNWLSGLRDNGHDVWYVEDDNVWPYDPVRDTVTDDCSYAVDHIRSCLARIGMPDKWAFRFRGDSHRQCWGLNGRQIDQLYRSCDVLLNIVGATVLGEEQLAAPLRVYVETDPVIAELKLASGDHQTEVAFAHHQVLFTYGENYGAPDCGVPIGGAKFKTTRQPVDLTWWPPAIDEGAAKFTTIGNYRQDGYDVRFGGRVYRWSKHHEWEKIISLPSRTDQPFELCLNVVSSDQRRLERHGWGVVPALRMSLDVFDAYPEYIRRSRGELTVAKDQNVRLRSGWFSERDACYLASGKPVIAQDTGFSNVLPTGEGLFAFTTADQALAAIEEINGDYTRHAKAARAIAEELFEAKAVAAALLREIESA